MYSAKAKGKTGELTIYEDIGAGWFGGVTAKHVVDDLKAMGDVTTIDLFLNSPGGSVFEGVTIYNALNRHPASINVHIDGLAASIASVIAMVGDDIRIAENAMMMIHDPWGVAMGNAEDMREQAELLDRVRDTLLDTYVARTKGDRAKISDQMAAETWFSAQEAIDAGFAHTLVEAKRVAACADKLSRFKNAPEALIKAAVIAPVEQSAVRRISPVSDKLAAMRIGTQRDKRRA